MVGCKKSKDSKGTNICETIGQIINASLSSLNVDVTCLKDIPLDFPTDPRFGDLSTNIALQLSRFLKKSPYDIAQSITSSIKTGLEKSPAKDYIEQVKIEAPGFINFYLNNRYFYSFLKDIVNRGKRALKTNLGKKRRVLIEFVSANPTGPLSVAHGRLAAVGDALRNILHFLGFAVKKEYYLNDEGNQINMLGESLCLRLSQLQGKNLEFPTDYYQGEYIKDIAQEISDKRLKIKDYAGYAVKHILKIIKKELKDFGVRFDYWYSQKELRKSGRINKTLKFLEKKGFLYEQDGALWFKSTRFGDDKDRVVVKTDGAYTYLAPDIAYHQDKYRRSFKWLINLWGPDHHGYINRLKAAVAALGHKPESLSIIIVQLASLFREGKPLQMSTRRGQYITLREVLEEVGLDTARFFFLMRRTSSHLDFDLEVAKKQTPENPVYYVQYAHARICSILRNSSVKLEIKNLDFTLLKEKEEIDLIKKLWQFSFILNVCLKTLDPYMLTVYVQELAEIFHKFYDQHRVLGKDHKLTQVRLALIEAVRIVVALALDLLGVSQPEKM